MAMKDGSGRGTVVEPLQLNTPRGINSQFERSALDRSPLQFTKSNQEPFIRMPGDARVNRGSSIMNATILASACVLILSAGGAFARAQPAPGASGPITRVIIRGTHLAPTPAGRWIVWNGIP